MNFDMKYTSEANYALGLKTKRDKFKETFGSISRELTRSKKMSMHHV